MDSARADPKVEPPFDVSSPDDAGRKQFWSITQFYSVGFLQSRIKVKNVVFTNTQLSFASVVFVVVLCGEPVTHVGFLASLKFQKQRTRQGRRHCVN